MNIHTDSAAAIEAEADTDAKTATAIVAETPARSPGAITRGEFRSMRTPLKTLLNGRAASLLLAFEGCMGKRELTVSSTDIRKSCNPGHLEIKSIVNAINERWHKRDILFRILAVPNEVHRSERFTLSRKEPARKPTATVTSSATRAEYVPFDESKRGPEDSNLTNAQWETVLRKIIEASPSGRARDDKDHPLLSTNLMRKIFDARPRPVPLPELDAMLIGAGSRITRMWDSRANIMNTVLRDAGLPFRIKKKPSQRLLRSIPLAAGDVTLYTHVAVKRKKKASQKPPA